MSSLREKRIAKTQDLKRLRRLSSSNVNTNGDNKASDQDVTSRGRAHSTLPTPQYSSNSLPLERTESVKVSTQSRHIPNKPPKYIFSDEVVLYIFIFICLIISYLIHILNSHLIIKSLKNFILILLRQRMHIRNLKQYVHSLNMICLLQKDLEQ